MFFTRNFQQKNRTVSQDVQLTSRESRMARRFIDENQAADLKVLMELCYFA